MGFFFSLFFKNSFPLFKNKSFTLAPVILVYHPEGGDAWIRIVEQKIRRIEDQSGKTRVCLVANLEPLEVNPSEETFPLGASGFCPQKQGKGPRVT